MHECNNSVIKTIRQFFAQMEKRETSKTETAFFHFENEDDVRGNEFSFTTRMKI